MRRSFLLSALLASICLQSPAFADAPNVVTSVKPVHSMVAKVMEGVGEPYLIVQGAASPHNYALKPSDASQLQQADVVFWVGENLEGFLAGSISNIATKAKVVELADAEGVAVLPVREGGTFDGHGHEDEHGHDDKHADEKHDDAHDHGHDEVEKSDHADHNHADEHDHAHEGGDGHIWLDTQNALAMVDAISSALTEADAENAARYQANAENFKSELLSLELEIAEKMQPLADRPFVVFHDAYQYFEKRFGLNAAGSITVNPEVAPGAQRVRELQARLGELEAVCVFAEPQFDANIVAIVTEGTSAKTGILDPLGASIDDGPELYTELLRGIANEAASCLSDAS